MEDRENGWIDHGALSAFAEAFHRLYADKGPLSVVDRNSLVPLVELAAVALGHPGKGGGSQGGWIKDGVVSARLRSAAALLEAMDRAGGVEITEVDGAYAILAAQELGRSPHP